MRSGICCHTSPIATLMIPRTRLTIFSPQLLAHPSRFPTPTPSCSWERGSALCWLNWMDRDDEQSIFHACEPSRNTKKTRNAQNQAASLAGRLLLSISSLLRERLDHDVTSYFILEAREEE